MLLLQNDGTPGDGEEYTHTMVVHRHVYTVLEVMCGFCTPRRTELVIKKWWVKRKEANSNTTEISFHPLRCKAKTWEPEDRGPKFNKPTCQRCQPLHTPIIACAVTSGRPLYSCSTNGERVKPLPLGST